MRTIALLASLLACLSGCSGPSSSTITPENPTVSPSALAQAVHQGARFALMDGGVKVSGNRPLPPKRKLKLHLQALGKPCLAVVTAFRPNQIEEVGIPARYLQLDRPEEIELEARECYLYITVVPTDSAESERLKGLVAGWKQKESRQALHQSISDWYGRRNSELGRSGPIPHELGGVILTSASGGHPAAAKSDRPATNQPKSREGNEIVAWISQADWVACNSQEPGVFLYSIQLQQP